MQVLDLGLRKHGFDRLGKAPQAVHHRDQDIGRARCGSLNTLSQNLVFGVTSRIR